MTRTSILDRVCVMAVAGSLLLFGAGCQTAAGPGHETSNVIPGTEAGADTSYRLQVGDTLAIHFFSYPDLDDTIIIGPDGHVSLRLVDDFAVAGMTLAEATNAINSHYEHVINHPGVNIQIKNYALQQIYVSGQVNNPGVIRSTVPLTASGAIAQAGGIKLAVAHSEGTLLLRRKPDGTIVYYKLGMHGDLPGDNGDPILRTNDLIYVPRTPIAVVADFVQANLTRVIPLSASATAYHAF
jgi:protein involved in polysaccharide export with SLBB domain